MNKNSLKNIPNEWITKHEAIGHVMAVMECSREEAEAILKEFEEAKPSAFMTVLPS